MHSLLSVQILGKHTYNSKQFKESMSRPVIEDFYVLYQRRDFVLIVAIHFCPLSYIMLIIVTASTSKYSIKW